MLNVVFFKVLYEFGEDEGSLIGTEELSVFTLDEGELASFKHLFVGVFGFFDCSQFEIDLVANLVTSAGSTVACMLLSFDFVSFSFLITGFDDSLMAKCEFFFHFIMSGMGTKHPWVANDISH